MLRPAVWLTAVGVLASVSPADEPEFNGRKLSAWAAQLREDATPRKRRAAAVAIGQIASAEKDALPVALQSLGRALRNDASPAVREQAVAAITQLKIEDTVAAVPDLTESLRTEQDVSVRRAVVASLGRFGRLAKLAVAPLTQSLKDADPGIRAAAADALGRVGADARASAPELLQLLGDTAKPVRLAAAFSLGRIEPEDTAIVASALTGLLRGNDPELKREALAALGFLGDRNETTVNAVAGLLRDSDVEFRRETALTLARFGSAARTADNQLRIAAVNDADKSVRLYSLRALAAAYGTESSTLVPFLTERLANDPDFEVRVAAAEELGALGESGKSALTSLRNARRDSQIKVREAAALAIKRIETPTVTPKP